MSNLPIAFCMMTCLAFCTDIYGVNQAPNESIQSVPADSLSSYTNLDEIVVKANSPLLKSDGNRLEYNVEEDPTAGGSMLIDILRKTPLVTVDGQDNIMVNGKSDYKLLINGKEEPMVQQNASLIFKNMPASMVSKIEVITDPGAKYDAEGVGGVLNIVIERKRKGGDGYNGQLSLTFGRQSNYVSGYATGQHKNLTLSATVTYADGHIFPQSQEKDAWYEYPDNQLVAKMHTWEHSKNTYGYADANLSASWEPNVADLFTASVHVGNLSAKFKDYQIFSRSMDATGNILFGDDQSLTGGMKNLSLSANAGYQHNFRPQNNYLSLSYLFNFGRSRLNFLSGCDDTIGYFPMYKFLNSDNNDYTREHTVQGDYVNGFGSEKHLFETGMKGIFRRNGSFSYQSQGNDVGALSSVPGADQIFAQYQDIFAVYGSYTGTYGPVSTRLGLRYEHADMGMKFRVGDTPDFNRSLDNAVPNASLTYSFGPTTNLRVAYAMRITRPSISQVNPFETEVRGQGIRKGNPDLTSERNNNVSLKFSKFGSVVGGNIGIEYSNTANAISGYTYMQDGIMVVTEANIGHKEETSLTGFFNWSILSGMSANLSGRVGYIHMLAPSEGLKAHGWHGDFNLSWVYRTRNDFTFAAYGGMSTKRIELQGSNSGWHYYGLSAGKDLLKNKSLNVTLSAMNMFEDRVSFVTTTNTPDLRFRQTFKMKTWNVGITLTWKFGNSQASVKKTDTEIINDDTSTGASTPGQGGAPGQGGGISL